MKIKEYNKHLIEIIVSLMPIMVIIFIYDIQLRVYNYDSGLWFFLLACIGSSILAIIFNIKEKKENYK